MNELNDHKSRAHALLSASSAHRWLTCPPSAVAAEAYPEQDTDYTKEGTLAHEVAEWVASGKSKTQNLDKGQDDGITAEMLEHALAYRDYIQELVTTDDPLILLEQRVDFSPWVPEGFGTADCIIIQGDTMDVIDYKYGQGVPVSAVDNPQEKLYGLGALNDYGFAYDVKRVRLHIFQPRIGNISVDELSAADLLAWGETVKPIAEQAAKGKGKYKEGAHCTFCPHAGRCRKLSSVCKEFVETHDLRVAVPVLAPHELAEVLQMAPLIELWMRKVKAQAMDALMNGDEVPGYKVVEGKLGNRKWSNELEVAQVLQSAGYQLNDITETKLLAPAAMDKSIGKKRVAELLTDHITRAPGAPTIVPETDKRPAYNRADDFDNLDE
jgi:hypothetical protein